MNPGGNSLSKTWMEKGEKLLFLKNRRYFWKFRRIVNWIYTEVLEEKEEDLFVNILNPIFHSLSKHG